MVHNFLPWDKESYVVCVSLIPVLSPGHHSPIYLSNFVESQTVHPFDISDNPMLRSHDLCYEQRIVFELASKFCDLCVWLYRPTVISLEMWFLYQSESTSLCSSQFVMKTRNVSTQKLLGSDWRLLIREVPFLRRVLSSGTDAASSLGTRSEPLSGRPTQLCF